MFLRVAVVVSGRGSNLASLLRALGEDAPAGVVLVISNRRDAAGLTLAWRHGVPTHVLQDSADPAEWRRVLDEAAAGLVVLAGYLKRVPESVVRAWRGRIINIHPALLPLHGGAGMYGHRVHQAVLAAGETVSGATVHLVTEEYDQGEVLGQARVPVLPGDTPESLAARVLQVEHRLLPAAVLAAAAAGRPVPFTLDEVGSALTPNP
ncbi:MAG TPA: phosphoribosylglycinamide formyltransferase [Gemmatimonadales bacterium]|jgi:formyltetrahydrofolate-dependent phosphoribosylglycinamide formyltransferase|nr:phosphoribosylglycinamide formyltransferase [Gemmatimonadales bacterium]